MVVTLATLKKTARRWVPYWRDRLGLRDWHVDIEYVDGLEPLAECQPNYPHRRACIALTTEVRRWAINDVEQTIVHEMLHIHFGTLGVGLSSKSYHPQKMDKVVLAEQVINALAKCLVDRRRGVRD